MLRTKSVPVSLKLIKLRQQITTLMVVECHDSYSSFMGIVSSANYAGQHHCKKKTA